MRRTLFAVLLVFSFLVPATAQEIQVSRQNKTIAVTAEESVTVDPEVAVVMIGYHSYGPTQDAALQDNLRVSAKIIQALLDAHIPKESIETKRLQMQLVDPDEKWTPEMKKDRQFEARQSWTIRVPASQANAVVDVATQAGVNEIDGVAWTVADPTALQAKASGAALAKARAISEQMARGLNAKLGDLVYASNKPPAEERFVEAFWQRRDSSVIVTESGTARPNVQIFPEKVKSTATVYAVFAIE